MPQLVTVRCPNCGANLRLAVGVEWVTCDYCKAESFVRRPKASPPSRPPPADVPVIELPEAPNTSTRVGSVVAMLFVAGAVIGAVALFSNSSLSDVAMQSRAMLFDVNRDGAADALVAGLVTGQMQKHVRALDARTGETLWKSEDLGDARRGLNFALSGDAVLVLDGHRVTVLAARTGKERFSKTLPERVEVVCEADDGAVLLLVDHSRHALDVRSGALRALAPATRPGDEGSPWCHPAWGTMNEVLGKELRVLPWRSEGPERMQVDDHLQLRSVRTTVLTGHRGTGSRVPALAGVVDGEVVWHETLPGQEPLLAKEGDPSGVTLTQERVVAAYSYAQKSGFVVVARSLVDGALLWETEVPRERDPGSVELSADENHVFATANSAVHALSARDGKLLWSLGWGLDL